MFGPAELPCYLADETYRLVRILGKGGMAVVYEADVDLERFDFALLIAHNERQRGGSRGSRVGRRDQRYAGWRQHPRSALEALCREQGLPYPADGRAAVKVMQPHLDAHDRFQAEWESLIALSHPNLIRVYGGGLDAERGLHYYVMERLDGILPTRRGVAGLSIAAKLSVIAQAAAGLECLHARGIIHRDVKPDNILCTQAPSGELRARITDLGIAKESDRTTGLTRSGQFLGTPRYASPEQFEETKQVSSATDIYSLGASLYFLLSGKPPFHGLSSMELAAKLATGEAPRSIRDVTEGAIPELLEVLVERMMAPDPGARPATMRRVIEAIALCVASAGEAIQTAVRCSELGGHPRADRAARRQLDELLAGPAAGSTSSATVVAPDAAARPARPSSAAGHPADGRRLRRGAAIVAGLLLAGLAAVFVPWRRGPSPSSGPPAGTGPTRPVRDDTTPPRLSGVALFPALVRPGGQVRITGSADEPLSSATIDGRRATLDADRRRFGGTLTAGPREGTHRVTIRAIDAAGNRVEHAVRLAVRWPRVQVALTSPASDVWTQNRQLRVEGRLEGELDGALEVRTGEQPLARTGEQFSGRVTLPDRDGAAVLEVVVWLAGHPLARARRTVHLDRRPPVLSKLTVTPPLAATGSQVTVSGRSDEPLERLTVATIEARLETDRQRFRVRLAAGDALGRRHLKLVARDRAGNPAEAVVALQVIGPAAAAERSTALRRRRAAEAVRAQLADAPGTPAAEAVAAARRALEQGDAALEGADFGRAAAAYQEGERRYRGALAQRYIVRGAARYATGQHRTALQDFERAVRADPENPRAHFNRAITLYALGRYEAAVRDADVAIRLREEAQYVYARGLANRRLKHADRALADFVRACELQADHWNAWYQRGLMLIDLQRRDDALSALREALRLAPTPHQAQIKTHIESLLGQTGQAALAAANRARTDLLASGGTDDPALAAELAEARRRLEAPGSRADGQERLLRVAAAYLRRLAARHFERAEALYRAGKFRLTVDACDQALAAQPEHHAARHLRGVAHIKLGLPKEALADLDAAVAQAPDNASYHYDRGRLRAQQGNLNGAVVDFEAAVKADERLWQGWYQLGQARKKLSQDALAAAAFRRALGLAPPRYRAAIKALIEQLER